MPCNCGKAANGSRINYVATFGDGTTKTYASEVEARIAVAKKGGSYKAAASR